MPTTKKTAAHASATAPGQDAGAAGKQTAAPGKTGPAKKTPSGKAAPVKTTINPAGSWPFPTGERP